MQTMNKNIDRSDMEKGISVIVPVYNREKFLGSCIESILSQDYDGNLEIIVSDDGSTDKSLKIARSYGEKVCVLEKPKDCKDQGASGARNRGIAIARYSYIGFLDSDDYYLPEHIKRMVDALDDNEEIDYVFCRSKQEILSESGEKKIIDWTRKRLSRLDKEYHVLSRSHCINTNSIVLRTNVFSKVGVFNVFLSNGEDSEMWMRVAESFNGKFLDYFGSVYRREHGDEQLSLADLELKENCSSRIYAEAFARNYINKKSDKLRLLLIVRGLLYGKLSIKNWKIGILYNHIIVTIKLFSIFPYTTIKFLRFYLM